MQQGRIKTKVLFGEGEVRHLPAFGRDVPPNVPHLLGLKGMGPLENLFEGTRAVSLARKENPPSST